MKYKTIACLADYSEKAQEAYKSLSAKYRFVPDVHAADVIIVLGGDGFMLHKLHKYMELNKPIYGMNCGTVGFLMNEYRESDLIESINQAQPAQLHPLHMVAIAKDGTVHNALAINEVSLLRCSKQAARIRIKIDGKVRMEELMCDGVLLATPAGSTAYNLSVHGPIIPIKADILALTPISPFRPRRWKGALIHHSAEVEIEILENEKRPVSAVADFTEVKDVRLVKISEERKIAINILFDSGHSLEERIISEQFAN
jgi:NAD+ kinase